MTMGEVIDFVSRLAVFSGCRSHEHHRTCASEATQGTTSRRPTGTFAAYPHSGERCL